MSLSLAATRARLVSARETAEGRERSVRRRLGVAWGLLMLDVMGYQALLVHVPSAVGKIITQGALPVALLVLLSVNRRVLVRPSVFLCLVTLLPLEAIVTALQPQFFGTVYRTFRLAEFVAALWLLSPWFGRRDLLLVRYHLITLSVVLTTVIAGIPVSPGRALGSGRLDGTLWYIPGTQIAHYAAIVIGMAVMLWACGYLSSGLTGFIVVVVGTMLVLTHTRTALAGLVVGIVVGGLSLVDRYIRMRRVFAVAIVIVPVGIVGAYGFIVTWLARGESAAGIADLTGRTKVWTALLAIPRTHFQEIFGFGLSNSSFNGLAIDSNWLSSYQEQGLFGVTVCAAILILLLVAAFFQPSGVRRAIALFLVTYCLIASFTEDGFTDATPYLLDLAVAASVLMPALRARGHPDIPPGPEGGS